MVDLNALREAMGMMQHHDAITGTEKQHVANDYARQLQRGMNECEIITNAAISKLLEVNIELKTCPLLNVSQCTTTTTNDSFVVTIYNPLSRPVDKVVRLPVKEDSYSVNDLQGTEYKTQIIPILDFIKNIPGRSSQVKNELIFIARGIPALGWKSYRVLVYRKTNKNIITSKKGNKYSVKDTAFIIDPNTGLINSLTIKNVSIDLSQNFFYYNGFVGDNSKFESRSSGAYVFRPDGPLQKITNKKVDYKVYEGELVAEIHQTLNEYIGRKLYYPVTTQISIKDTENELAVLVDIAQGDTSLKDRNIELMVHRNCLHDDAFGVGEALNETAFGLGLVVRGSHYITVGNQLAALTKDIVQRRLLDTWTFVVPVDEKVKHNMEDLFTWCEIISAQETTLGGNQWLKDSHRLHFETNR
ncbi:unnamed protein product [Ceutorhynchus assimilis]|uniref:Lysosomal alpha-mannosidase n=1 Tax=Ceutorhynchus assimilis TaxID=467358 RepID=A0A9N9QJV8_9CUCU|nr:unnamed protein product [Ceutorhynchus assimilis]